MKSILLINLGALLFYASRMLVASPVTNNRKQSYNEIHTESTRTSHSATLCNCSAEINQNPQEYKIPNIVHYIWHNTATYPLEFHHLLSILSAYKVLQPDHIFFHTSFEPGGFYWEQAKKLPRFQVLHREPPTQLFGEDIKPPKYYTSHSNVDRVVVLRQYGGIYLDLDTIVIRPFDDLRRDHNCVISLEQPTKACGSIILCAKDSFFLNMWINAYLDDYRMDEWAYNTGQVPANIARRFPNIVHVEETSMNRPNFMELDQIWGPNTFDWKSNYALHIWYRLWKDTSPYFNGVIPNEFSIRDMNNTFGQIARSLYYGTSDLLSTNSIQYL